MKARLRNGRHFRLLSAGWMIAQLAGGGLLAFHPSIALLPRPEDSLLARVLAGVAVGTVLCLLIQPKALQALLRAPFSRCMVSAVAMAFFAVHSLAEELLWRGAAFLFTDTLSLAWTLALTTLVFGALHGVHQGAGGILRHLVTGLSFALLAWHFEDLTAPVIAHILFNHLQLLSRNSASVATK